MHWDQAKSSHRIAKQFLRHYRFLSQKSCRLSRDRRQLSTHLWSPKSIAQCTALGVVLLHPPCEMRVLCRFLIYTSQQCWLRNDSCLYGFLAPGNSKLYLYRFPKKCALPQLHQSRPVLLCLGFSDKDLNGQECRTSSCLWKGVALQGGVAATLAGVARATLCN